VPDKRVRSPRGPGPKLPWHDATALYRHILDTSTELRQTTKVSLVLPLAAMVRLGMATAAPTRAQRGLDLAAGAIPEATRTLARTRRGRPSDRIGVYGNEFVRLFLIPLRNLAASALDKFLREKTVIAPGPSTPIHTRLGTSDPLYLKLIVSRSARGRATVMMKDRKCIMKIINITIATMGLATRTTRRGTSGPSTRPRGTAPNS
jgi:hypothetical protein